MLADRLAAQRLLVAHVSIGPELAQRARDHVLRHLGRPDRLHQERRHQHVAAEVGGEVGESRHELLAVGQELHAPHFPLEPLEALRVCRVGPHARREAPEVVVEDLVARERRQRGGVRRDADGHPDRTPGRALDADGGIPCTECGNGLPRVALQRQREMTLAVEARLLDPHHPGRVAPLRRHARSQPRAERVDGLHTEERQLPVALRRLQPSHVLDELGQLGLGERDRVEG